MFPNNNSAPSVLWKADPHTLAKHHILKYYLGAWAAVFWRTGFPASSMLFFEGFAGPGEYEGGEPGSPIVALNAIREHSAAPTAQKRVRFTCVELDPPSYNHLRSRLTAERAALPAGTPVILDEPILGDCRDELPKIIASRKPNVGPALFFLDQYGYSNVSMSMVKEIMSHRYCEVFSYLNCEKLNPYLADETKWPAITRGFGDESWKEALNAPDRQQRLIDLYKAALKRNAGVKYPWSFAMFSKHNVLLHWLVFSTNDLKGLEEMKKAMWSADRTGSYRFSDSDDPTQQRFFSDANDQWMADELSKMLSGRTMSYEEIYEFVLTRTPGVSFKKAINILRKQKRATPKDIGVFPVTFAGKP